MQKTFLVFFCCMKRIKHWTQLSVLDVKLILCRNLWNFWKSSQHGEWCRMFWKCKLCRFVTSTRCEEIVKLKSFTWKIAVAVFLLTILLKIFCLMEARQFWKNKFLWQKFLHYSEDLFWPCQNDGDIFLASHQDARKCKQQRLWQEVVG